MSGAMTLGELIDQLQQMIVNGVPRGTAVEVRGRDRDPYSAVDVTSVGTTANYDGDAIAAVTIIVDGIDPDHTYCRDRPS